MYLTLEQACILVCRSERTVRYWIEKGQLRPIMRGKRHWFRDTDVLEAERRARRRLPPSKP